ncbi:leucine-rich repeat-containing protein 71 isoform X1 [Petromyzon marinus]|uniref:leucine-rich repeat-containing protein 71 isoform X1 n=2 Tax=Petromyzon marinus TaxID=7757 RepID=UPI003F6E559F
MASDSERSRWKNALERVTMGKKTERAARESKGQLSNSTEDDSINTPEEYQCNGNFEQDFTQLCTLTGLASTPAVVRRSHPPTAMENTGAENVQNVAPSEEDITPTTFTTKDKFVYFKPCVQVEPENEDNRSSVKEIYIRGWKIEEKMMSILKKCLPAIPSLTTINFWNAGIDEDTLDMFVSVLPLCTNLKTLVLEGNPEPKLSYHKLIGEGIMIGHLSLRNNRIDDDGARLLGQALSTTKTTNKTLLSLNLAYNCITDLGGGYIAHGLRLNRTLLCLSLAHNKIGDNGAVKLAEILARFPLTHEEVVQRRILLSEVRSNIEIQKSVTSFQPVTVRRADSKLDHHSVIDKGEKATGKGTKPSTKKKQELAQFGKKDDKSSTGSTTSGILGSAGPLNTSLKKDESKLTKKVSAVGDLAKGNKGKGVKSGNKDKKPQTSEPEMHEAPEAINPLMDHVEHHNGQIFLPGNQCLISLNLAWNNIGQVGLEAFLKSIRFQLEVSGTGAKKATGIMRISLQRNAFPSESKSFKEMCELMESRDPMYKTVTNPAEEDESAAMS